MKIRPESQDITTETFRFIHSSDWQLGMTRYFLSEEAAARFHQDRIDAIRSIGELAVAHDAAFIVVAGDVFESNQLSRQTLLRSFDAIRALPVPVFLLPGNHDPLDAASVFNLTEFPTPDEGVFVLDTSHPVEVPGLAQVQVVGAPWRTKRPDSDICNDMLAALQPVAGICRIAVCHGQPDVLSPDKDRPETIRLNAAEAALDDGRIHYLALGDRHSVTSVGSSGRIWFSGAPVATDFTETNPNQVLLVEVADQNCQVTPLDCGRWLFVAEHFELNDEEDLKHFSQWLIQQPDKARTVLKVGFTGTINLAMAGRLDALMEEQAELYASLRYRERTSELVIAPDQLDADSVSLSGYARSAWQELLAAADSDPVALAALRLFYRASQVDQQS